MLNIAVMGLALPGNLIDDDAAQMPKDSDRFSIIELSSETVKKDTTPRWRLSLG